MTGVERRSPAGLVALAASTIVLAAGLLLTPPAGAATCGAAVPYPGNSATSVEYARWMASGALAEQVPGELPVMAALVESGLRNLNYGDRDSVGFFQMRTSIWDTGRYKGYLKKPDLQLRWFLDTAASVRKSHIARGKGDPAASSATYGVWIADIERPAEQYRGRYQLRLREATDLVERACPGMSGINVLAPRSSLSLKRRQRPARSGAISISVKCPKAACIADARAHFRLPGRRGVLKLSADTTMISPGHTQKVKIRLPRTVRASVRKRLRGGRSTRARVRISVAGVATGATVRVRRIVLTR